ncbi:unnamed protein product [Soboliphyme baturini]|uniref:Ephrin_rec_like domain-containing protein n=1 Tax=Soboliphyme baturini TaxID=241478 RepID=A0A183J482_9BILA|nr:unnamed protein product [Soboliphyme baturini]
MFLSGDFHYEYTECDKYGGRWRVAVPSSPDKCKGGSPPAAERGPDCSFTCGPGEVLDITTQVCVPCPAGTYSLGGGVRFEDFTSLPSGFSINNENPRLRNSEPAAVTTDTTPQPPVNCSS